jgi:signal transduction histidine kinase
MLDRLHRRLAPTPARADALLAALLAVPSVVQMLIAPIAPLGIALAIALVSTVPIAWRRSRPVAAAAVGLLPGLVPTDASYLVLGYVAIFILLYSAGAYEPSGARVVAVATFGVAIAVLGSVLNSEVLGEYVGAVAAVVLPAVVGRVVRRHREQERRLEELTLHLERERERSAHAAVAEERARIARELHDVVAHGVSVIAIQSDAAEAALDRDPALARAPLRTIRGSATEALEEMRRLLGVLRDDSDDLDLAPQPGLALLPELIERAREAGPVTLEVEGAPRPLPASVDLSAYRIVQEALTNVRKHAGGAAATVRLRWRPAALEIAVRDEGAGAPPVPANGSGHGLVGMRERVRLHRGELRAGPVPGGGFEVAAVLQL